MVEDEGTYVCVVENMVGRTQNEIKLRVHSKCGDGVGSRRGGDFGSDEKSADGDCCCCNSAQTSKDFSDTPWNEYRKKLVASSCLCLLVSSEK